MKSEGETSIIRGVLEEELERNTRMRNRYYSELEKLPKGSVFLRKLGNKEYYYLKYRENGKSIAKYLGKKDVAGINNLKELIKKRRHIEDVISRLISEKKEIEKALKIRRS